MQQAQSEAWVWYLLAAGTREGNGTPLQYSCLENRTESDTTEVTQPQQLREPGQNTSPISALVSFLFYKMEIIKNTYLQRL